MIQKRTLEAFVVALQWSDGIGSLSTQLAYLPEEAASLGVAAALRGQSGVVPQGALTNVMVNELPPELLRHLLAAIEAEPPESGMPPLQALTSAGSA